MSLILNIDTSLEVASVSISRNGEIIYFLKNHIQKEHAAFLHNGINHVLTKSLLRIADLQAVAVTIGPGSYTGLRVGLAAAKGLCYALGKPLITVGTLNAMAKETILQKDDGSFIYCPMIDARRNEVYTAMYDADMVELTPPHAAILTGSTFSERLKSNKILFFGSGSYKWKDICNNPNALFKNNNEIINGATLISFEKYLNEDFADISLTIPLYTKDFFDNK